MTENQFNSIFITRYLTAQNYINAIENAQQDITEIEKYCDDVMMISKIIREFKKHSMYKNFVTQYHLFRDIDSKFEELNHVITQLFIFEFNNFSKPDFRTNVRNVEYENDRVNTRNGFLMRQ